MRLAPLVILLCFPTTATIAQAATPQSPFLSFLIENAEAKIKKSPASAQGYSDLAFALARRARETENPEYLIRAERAIAAALQREPGNFEARQVRVIVRIAQGRFEDAEEEGRALNKQTPDNNLMYGLLADIALARGKYAEAETLTQRMLDMRQVNGPGLQRAARLREVIGFPDGAIDFWDSARKLASVGDTEERAYILTQLAGVSRRRAKLDDAAQYAASALSLEAGYPAALLEQARIALDRNQPAEAVAALTVRLEQGYELGAQYWLAEALDRAGKPADAQAAAARFVKDARAIADLPENRNELLVRYLTSHAQVAEAVRIGKKAVEKGANLGTGDAYAMALLAAGNVSEARVQMSRVLEPGVLNQEYFLHAAQIRRKDNDLEGSRSFLKKCIEVNANSRYAEEALRQLQAGTETGAK